MRSLVTLTLILATILPVATSEAAGTRIPGTSVTLEPPAGFVPMELVPGFWDPDSAAQIIVIESPRPLERSVADFRQENVAIAGITLVSNEIVELAGHDATLVRTDVSVAGTGVIRWVLLFGDEESTVQVKGTLPRQQEARWSAAIERSLRSARWDPQLEVGLFDGLPFRVQETATLKVASRVAATIMLTEGGVKDQARPESPRVLVDKSAGPLEGTPLEDYAWNRLRFNFLIKDIDLPDGNGRPVTLAGLPGHELIAEARDRRTGVPITVYQAVAIDGEWAYYLLARVGRQRGAAFLPQFREIAQSLELVP